MTIPRISTATLDGEFWCIRYGCDVTAEFCLKRQVSFEYSGCLQCIQGANMTRKFGRRKGFIDPDVYSARIQRMVGKMR